MITTRRRVMAVVIAALAPATVAAGLAWACTPQAQFTGFGPSSGPGGSIVSLSGASFTAEPITIHWGSAAGPVLATTQGPQFAVSVRVPIAPPDTYAIVAVARGANGSQSGQASRAFTIAGPAAAPAGNTSATSSGAQSGATGKPTGTGSSGQASGAASASGKGGKSSATVSLRAGKSSTAATSAAGVTAATPQPVASASSSASRSSTSRGATQARNAAPASFFEAPAARTSERTAGSELWSAFNSGQRAGEASGVASAAVQTNASSQTIGLVMLVLGFVALMGGVAAAATRRRRASIRARRQR